MLLFNRRNGIRFSIGIAGVLLIFLFTILSSEPSWYSTYQHPYVTLALLFLYIFCAFDLNIKNCMVLSRFHTFNAFVRYLLKRFSLLSTVYFIPLFLIFIGVGFATGTDVSPQRLLIYGINTFGNLLLINYFFIVVSLLKSQLLAKIFLFSLIGASFALNFSGFYKVNIFSLICSPISR